MTDTYPVSPSCFEDDHQMCTRRGWDAETQAGKELYCPCHCHDGDACGKLHEAPGLSYLGPCLMGPWHEGLCVFAGPIRGSVMSIRLEKAAS